MFQSEAENMKYEELSNVLIQRFPNLIKSINVEMDTFDCYKPGPNVLYGNVLNPYVKELLEHENNKVALQQVFKFYEELAQSEDEEVKNLLQVTLLEALWDDGITYDKACEYMLPMTKHINGLIAEYFNSPPK